MTVHAPFRFAPIHRWVYFPDWAELVTHDVPFKDGFSGEIEIEIEARTPLLIGGPRRKATGELEGEVWPFRLPDGRYAIPGSSLQGMVRSILEIAAFGSLGAWIEEKRFGIRDLAPTATPHYQRRLLTSKYDRQRRVTEVRPNIKAGWLTRISDDQYVLYPCEYARVEYSDVVKLTSAKIADLTPKSNVESRYDAAASNNSPLKHKLWVEKSPSAHSHRKGALEIHYRLAQRAQPQGANSWEQRVGSIVLTGNPSDPPRNPSDPSKHLEFFFLDPTSSVATYHVDITPHQFDEFLSIHAPNDGRDHNPNWLFFKTRGYPGEKAFDKHGRMPIFYITDQTGRVDSFGLAFMFKLAHSKTTHQLLQNSTHDHLIGTTPATPNSSTSNHVDLPSLIFGSAADEYGDSGLKRRAVFDTARLAPSQVNPTIVQTRTAVLLSPKPSYYPCYIRQRPGTQTAGQLELIRESEDKRGRARKDFGPYATHTPIEVPLPRDDTFRKEEHTSPELSGVKIWPARNRVAAQVCPPHIAEIKKIQVNLNTLATGTMFTTTLRIHNLRRSELGAVLWALSFGDPAGWTPAATVQHHHRLGMGKPYGLGEVAIRIKALRAFSGDGVEYALPRTGHFVEAFENEVSRAYRAHAATLGQVDGDWRKSIQVESLLHASNPDFGRSRDTVVSKRHRQRPNSRALDYIELNPDQTGGWNDFVDAKMGGMFLPTYVDGQEFPRSSSASQAPGPAPNGGQPRPSRMATPQPGRPQPTPSSSRDPVIGDRVTVAGRTGTVTALPKDKRSPRWLIDFAPAGKPQWFARNVITILPPHPP
jgi:CRISPR-associated protein (TIGR03986 family)